VAAIIPRKGHEILVRALATIPERNWHLTCAGSVQREPSTVEQLRTRLRVEGLEDRVLLAGELDETNVAACYDEADVFVLPTLYEGYGMAVAEALARALPVISTATGAIPDLVAGGAGLLVPPGDRAALAAALSRVLGDDHLRAQLAEGARAARNRLPTWPDAAGRMADVLTRQAGAGTVK
jgi:glycosyltransferase involved in cell wall biosynthesis